MNKVILVGNLTRDPELTETSNGVSVCKFCVAVNRDYENNEGVKECDFFNITVWRGRAESCGKYLAKGSKVAVLGTLQNRNYEDKDGIMRYVTDVIANEVEFLSSNVRGDNSLPGAELYDKPGSKSKGEKPALSDLDNQLPF